MKLAHVEANIYALVVFFMISFPVFAFVAAMAAHTWMADEVLTPATAFAALTLFNVLRFPLIQLGEVLSAVIQAKVSVGRLEKFLQQSTTFIPTTATPDAPAAASNPSVVAPAAASDVVSIAGATFSWTVGGTAVLSDVSLTVAEAEFCVVLGKVGCGKTSLLLSILSETACAQPDRVSVRRGSGIALLTQDSWVLSSTLRENILFGMDWGGPHPSATHPPTHPLALHTVSSSSDTWLALPFQTSESTAK